ncbi:hypothetical protein BT96DRAFT_202314 [Gymnopus androsaceus JB14]|uniref:Uncharacterized protein n=1 Tax=Gymnopus androsaceus JB14 TaxID=1447944 RepID=A0A6A4H772_9AGAR|nr:hypothetical protein BT96DRAFT_202314 [Gymnopus androsaceus JB14]
MKAKLRCFFLYCHIKFDKTHGIYVLHYRLGYISRWLCGLACDLQFGSARLVDLRRVLGLVSRRRFHRNDPLILGDPLLGLCTTSVSTARLTLSLPTQPRDSFTIFLFLHLPLLFVTLLIIQIVLQAA